MRLDQMLQRKEYDPAAAERARLRLEQANQLCPGCSTCGGGGFVAVDGRMEVCPTRRAKLLRSGLPEYGLTADEIQGLNWKFLPDQNNAQQVSDQVRKIQTGQVFLYGEPGRGKTIILQNMVAERLRAGQRACYITLSALLQELRETYDPQEGDQLSDRLAWYIAVPTLCLDEIDKVDLEKPWVEEHTGRLLDERWRSGIRGTSLTLIASNEGPEKLKPYMTSRMRDSRGLCIEMTGKDARLRAPKGMRW